MRTLLTSSGILPKDFNILTRGDLKGRDEKSYVIRIAPFDEERERVMFTMCVTQPPARSNYFASDKLGDRFQVDFLVQIHIAYLRAII